jgi:hypothetical protein
MRIRLPVLLMALAAAWAAPRPASADVTIFLGATPTPSSRMVRGFAVGVSVIVLGFEFEYANTREEPLMAAPSLRTGMANLIVQTPSGGSGVQFYGTIGSGGYRERLEDAQETGFGINLGGGAKIAIAGPLRARLDYRMFNLHGSPLHSRVHRVYAGASVMF